MTKMVKALLNGKYELILPEHRARRPEWYTEQGWERARLDSMHDVIGIKYFHDPVVYYVGAEEGDMCALLATFGARLVMIEPNPLVWPNVKVIWDANKLKPPLASFAAFAAPVTDDFVSWSQEWPESVNGEVISDHGFKNLSEYDGTIPRVRIDDIASRTKLEPDIITLDIEGAEWEALRGAEETLRRCHPRIYLSLHPEFLFQQYGEYGHDLRQWIKGFGYKETLLDYQHEVHLLYEAVE